MPLVWQGIAAYDSTHSPQYRTLFLRQGLTLWLWLTLNSFLLTLASLGARTKGMHTHTRLILPLLLCAIASIFSKSCSTFLESQILPTLRLPNSSDSFHSFLMPWLLVLPELTSFVVREQPLLSYFHVCISLSLYVPLLCGLLIRVLSLHFLPQHTMTY